MEKKWEYRLQMKSFQQQRDDVLMIFFHFCLKEHLFTIIQAQFIERNNNCITKREWQEREVTYADSDFAETCCVDDIFDNTDNNSDEMIGDLLNDMNTKDETRNNNSPMKKKNVYL